MGINMGSNYKSFIKSKEKNIIYSGFECDSLNTNLFPFQKYIVEKALRIGKFAIFASMGLGKTLMQLEWASKVLHKTNQPVLILCPLAVSGQTIQEAKKFNIDSIVEKFNGEYDKKIYVINYEQLDNIDCSMFSGIVLDESSILKNFTGKIKGKIIDSFANTPYKLCCTATPSPNDAMELGNHSEFLNIMTRSEMLSMYFINDMDLTSKWRLKKHSHGIFYKWVASWSIMISKPSDIGFDDTGYNLPELNMKEIIITTPKKDNGKFFNDDSVSAIEFNRELKNTIPLRMDKVLEIVNNNKKDSFIIWIKQNEEGKYLQRKLLENGYREGIDFLEVQGSDNSDFKEKNLLGFANSEFRILITKTKIAQFGLNFQNCHNQIFPSVDFSFEGLYQSIGRSHRFGQNHKVNISLIVADTMGNVIESIKEKKKNFEKMQSLMAEYVRDAMHDKFEKINEFGNEITKTDNYKIYNGDCVEKIKELPDKSIHFSVFSPPFADLYTYSDLPEDMGNCDNYVVFMNHFKYLVKELDRVMMPGRNIAVHCMDLPIQKGKEGFIGLRDFSGMLIDLFLKNNFIYHSRITIWKDPVIEMQRTKALGLLHKQLKKDSTMSRVGLPDYILVFRHKGENPIPIKTDIDVNLWQKWASPVWHDIDYSDTLQFRTARDNNDERHICPLQLPTIERCINMWSNEGEIVLSPFGGIGSEGYQALRMGRKSISIELKKSYYDLNKRNHEAATKQNSQLMMFA